MALYLFLTVILFLFLWCVFKLNEGIREIKSASHKFSMLIQMVVTIQNAKALPPKTFYSAKALADLGEDLRKEALAAMDAEERKTALEGLSQLGM